MKWRRKFLLKALIFRILIMADLRYGMSSTLHFDLDGSAFSHVGIPRGRPLDDPFAATRHAVAEPLDYPPLGRSTTPGDRVVIALDSDIPQAAQVIAAVVQSLTEAGVDGDGIVILRPRAAGCGTEDSCGSIEAAHAGHIPVVVHEPDERKNMAYLAATSEGEPILIHRALHEADLILPIGRLRGDGRPGYFGIHGAVFPAFSDAKTLGRFRAEDAWDGRGKRHRHLCAESAHVAWLLGINFTIQVVPAAGERIMHVVAGQSDAVRQHGRELYHSTWGESVARRADLVVAAIEGGPSEQTWESLGQTLDAALSLVEDGGAIAVCSELTAEPGPGVQQMAGGRSRSAAMRRIAKESPLDALPASQLARALDNGPVYLLSGLSPSLLEDLEIVPVAAGEELVRLARRRKSCILLSNAARAMPGVEGE
jgi:nickel-dependent lactate racemase